MPQCAVHACGNSHRRTRGKPVHYHRFPQEAEVRMKWIEACNRKASSNGEPPFNISTARICSRHFTKDCYETVNGENDEKQTSSRLRRNVVPTLNLVPVEESLEEASLEGENKELMKILLRNAEIAAGGENMPSCSGTEDADVPRMRSERRLERRQERQQPRQPTRQLPEERNERRQHDTRTITKVSKKKYGFVRALGLAPRTDFTRALKARVFTLRKRLK